MVKGEEAVKLRSPVAEKFSPPQLPAGWYVQKVMGQFVISPLEKMTSGLNGIKILSAPSEYANFISAYASPGKI